MNSYHRSVDWRRATSRQILPAAEGAVERFQHIWLINLIKLSSQFDAAATVEELRGKAYLAARRGIAVVHGVAKDATRRDDDDYERWWQNLAVGISRVGSRDEQRDLMSK